MFILTFVLNLFDFYILDQYYFCFSKGRKRSYSGVMLTLMISALVLSVVNQTGQPILNLISSIFLIYSYSNNFNMSVKYYLFLPIFYFGLGFVTEPIGMIFLECFMGIFPSIPEVVTYFISVILCELIRFFIVLAIRNYWSGNLIVLPLKINLLLSTIPVFGIISCCIAIQIVWKYDMPEEKILCAVIVFMVLFSNILVFYVFKSLNKIYTSMYEKEMMIQEAKLKEEYYIQVDKSSQHLRKIRHDLKNRLTGIYGIENDCKLIRAKIKELIGELEESQQNIYTLNSALNAVLNVKYGIALKENIKIENNILVPKYMNIDYGDMGVLFGNLLDNAIEANRLVEEEKRWIDVLIKYEDHILLINIKNSKALKQNVKKKDYWNHGIGINSVKQIVEKYNGITEFQDLGLTYEASAILYGICEGKDFIVESKC